MRTLKNEEFRQLKKQKGASFKWMRLRAFLEKKQPKLRIFWDLPKKNIPLAVTRNRLKRWFRQELQKKSVTGLVLVSFLPPQRKGFYQALKREDFEFVFEKVFENFKNPVKPLK